MLTPHLRKMERDGLIVPTDLRGRRKHVLSSFDFGQLGDNIAHRCFDPVGGSPLSIFGPKARYLAACSRLMNGLTG